MSTDNSKGEDHQQSAISHRAIYLVFIAVFLDYLAVGMMRNMLPWVVESLGGGAILLGTLETAYGVGQLVGVSFLGRFSDLYGRRAILLLSALGWLMTLRSKKELERKNQFMDRFCDWIWPHWFLQHNNHVDIFTASCWAFEANGNSFESGS